MYQYTKALSFTLLYILSLPNVAAELKVGKICPVTYNNTSIGDLIFSKHWYHSSRSNARYIAGDNATGIGLEIHLKNNFSGKIEGLNFAECNQFRLLQIRKTNARLLFGEETTQIDIPEGFANPFYDNLPLEHGRGLHKTPIDDKDKPWKGRHYRDSTVAIYDTPYVSDAYGLEGEHIKVTFETCAVCQRHRGYDTVLSCGSWGYTREYMGGMTGWAEPEFNGVECKKKASNEFEKAIIRSNRVDYSYWIHWR
jgi:hypothetical protein